MIDQPETREHGEGLYSWETMEENYTVDIMLLLKELKAVKRANGTPMFPTEEKIERVMDRIQNFKRVFLNRLTGEVST